MGNKETVRVLCSFIRVLSVVRLLLKNEMATVSPVPMLNSVLTTSNDANHDFVNQLRTHLTEIENQFQQTLKHIQQHQPYTANGIHTKKTDPQIRNQFFDV